MKIAQVCPFFYPVEGGVEKHVLRISLELSRRGHQVEVFTSRGLRGSGAFPKSASVGRVVVHRYAPLLALGEFGSFWPGFAPKVLETRCDVIHSHSFRHPHCDISAATSKAVGARSVLTGHSPFHPNGVRSPLARGLTPVYDGIVAPFTLRAFDEIISLTEAERSMMIRLGAPRNHVTIIPNGVEDENFVTAPTAGFISRFKLEGMRIVLFLGRINRTKGLEYLLEAFARTVSEVPDCHLVLAGPATGPEEEGYLQFLISTADRLGVSSRVTLTGRLTDEDKLAALQACDIFVLPSLYEPFGIVLLEAAAHSKPIVSAASDGPSSILQSGDNGMLVRPGDAKQLGDAMVLLLEDSNLMRKLGRNGRITAEGYRWERIVDRIEDVYRGVN